LHTAPFCGRRGTRTPMSKDQKKANQFLFLTGFLDYLFRYNISV